MCLNEWGSTVTKADALSIEDLEATIDSFLEEEDIVSIPLIHASTSVRGLFYGYDAGFDDDSHHLRLNVRPASRLRKVIERVEIEKG